MNEKYTHIKGKTHKIGVFSIYKNGNYINTFLYITM
jgi:hypothetical protein